MVMEFEELTRKVLLALDPSTSQLCIPKVDADTEYKTLTEKIGAGLDQETWRKVFQESNVFEPLLRCAIRDAKLLATDGSDYVIKLLGFLLNSIDAGKSPTLRESAIDVLMEIFFSCEEEATIGKNKNIAQVCVWSLRLVRGRFPSKGGRWPRLLELIEVANHGAFDSDRIHHEGCKLLLALAKENGPNDFTPHVGTWTALALKSLCHIPRSAGKQNSMIEISKVENLKSNIRENAIMALVQGMKMLWPVLDSIAEILESEATWETVGSFLERFKNASVGSQVRIDIARSLGLITVLFGKSLYQANNERLNKIMTTASAMLSEASHERYLMLSGWKLVIEHMHTCGRLLSSVDKLKHACQIILAEGKEPDAQVRIEAFRTWTYLSSLIFDGDMVRKSGKFTSTHAVDEYFKTLRRALMDHNIEVRTEASSYVIDLFAFWEKSKNGSNGSHNIGESSPRIRNQAERRKLVFDSKLFLPSSYSDGTDISFIPVQSIHRTILSTLNMPPEFRLESCISLFRPCAKLWAYSLTHQYDLVSDGSELGLDKEVFTGMLHGSNQDEKKRISFYQFELIIHAIVELKSCKERTVGRYCGPSQMIELTLGSIGQKLFKEKLRILLNESAVVNDCVDLAGGLNAVLTYSFQGFNELCILWYVLGNKILNGEFKDMDTVEDIMLFLMMIFRRAEAFENSAVREHQRDFFALWDKLCGKLVENSKLPEDKLYQLLEESLQDCRLTNTLLFKCIQEICGRFSGDYLMHGFPNQGERGNGAPNGGAAVTIGLHLKTILSKLNRILTDLEKSVTSPRSHPNYLIALDCIEQILHKLDEKYFISTIEFMLTKEEFKSLIEQIFAPSVLARMKSTELPLEDYLKIVIHGLQSNDNAVKAICIEHWNKKYDANLLNALSGEFRMQLLRLNDNFSLIRGAEEIRTARKNGAKTPPSSASSSAKKKARVSDKQDRDRYAGVLYNDLEPSQVIRPAQSPSLSQMSSTQVLDIHELIKSMKAVTKSMLTYDFSRIREEDSGALKEFDQVGLELLKALWKSKED